MPLNLMWKNYPLQQLYFHRTISKEIEQGAENYIPGERKDCSRSRFICRQFGTQKKA